MNPSSKTPLFIIGAALLLLASFAMLIWWGTKSSEDLVPNDILPRSEWPRTVTSEVVGANQTVTNGIDGYRISPPAAWLVSETATRAGGLLIYFSDPMPSEIPLEFHEGGSLIIRVLAENQSASLSAWLSDNASAVFPYYQVGEFKQKSLPNKPYEVLTLSGQTFEIIGSPPIHEATDGRETLTLIKEGGTIFLVECRVIGSAIEALHNQCVRAVDSFEVL